MEKRGEIARLLCVSLWISFFVQTSQTKRKIKEIRTKNSEKIIIIFLSECFLFSHNFCEMDPVMDGSYFWFFCFFLQPKTRKEKKKKEKKRKKKKEKKKTSCQILVMHVEKTWGWERW